VVWKTLGSEGPPIVNVNGPRYGAIWGADRRLLGLNNIELITDRPLEVNLREIKSVKRKWRDRALVISLMVPCEESYWKDILKQIEDTEADGVELNFGCPHGMAERGMGSAVGQVPEYIEMVTRWVKQYSRMPCIVKLTPNVTSILPPADGRETARRRRCGQPDQHHQVDHQRRPRRLLALPDDRRQGQPRRLLRPGRQAHRAEHGGRDRPA
jgi:dihydropyrimidine dehydrogenase (NAD+) subunit PreA